MTYIVESEDETRTCGHQHETLHGARACQKSLMDTREWVAHRAYVVKTSTGHKFYLQPMRTIVEPTEADLTRSLEAYKLANPHLEWMDDEADANADEDDESE